MRITSPCSHEAGAVPESCPAFRSPARRGIVCAIFMSGAFVLPLAAGPADLDPAFGGTGKVIISGADGYSNPRSVLVQPDGKILLAGGGGDVAIVRLNSDGTLDTSFNGTGKAIKDFGGLEYVTCAALQTDGKIVMGGMVQTPEGTDFALFRFNADGSPDTGFGAGGKVTADHSRNDRIFCMGLQSDGRILVAGSLITTDENAVILRFRTDGSPDMSFNGTGKATSIPGRRYYGLVVQSDGKVALAGENNANLFHVTRYHANGTLDTGFGVTGTVQVGFGSGGALGIAQQSDGKLVAVGGTVSGNYGRISVARFNTNGQLDTSFNGTGRVVTPVGLGFNSDWASSVVVQPDGRIVVCGGASLGGTGGAELTLVRYNAGGSLDATFNGTGKRVLSGLYPNYETSMALQGDGKILVTGPQTGANQFTALRLTGGPPPSPDIAIEQPAGTPLPNRTVRDFGYIVKDGTATVNFTVKNRGTLPLTALHASIDGPDMVDFTITAAPPASLGPEATATLTVQFSPHAVGSRTATLFLVSNDPDETPLETVLTGTGTATATPDLRVEQPSGTEVPDGGAVTLNAVNASTLTTMEFTLKNTGSSGLTITGASIDGPHAGLFSLVTLPNGQLNSGASRTLTVRFGPDTPGVKTATLHITSNDPDESPYDITLTGTPVPEISVQQPPGSYLVSGSAAPVNFGTVLAGQSVRLTFAVKNTGWNDLANLAVTKSAAGTPGDFVVQGPGAPGLDAGDSAQFTVTFIPSAAGTRSATLQIASNAPNDNPFLISLAGARATAIETWRHLHFGILTNTGTASDLSDPDADGVVNLMEFATGSNPLAQNTPPGTLVKNGNTLELTYHRQKTALEELTYNLEWTTDPAATAWSTVGGLAVTVLSDDGVTELVKSTIAAGSSGKRFIRLRVTRK